MTKNALLRVLTLGVLVLCQVTTCERANDLVSAEALEKVKELEQVANATQPSGLYTNNNGILGKRASHVPRLEQIGWNSVRLRVAHASTWTDPMHAIEYAYIKSTDGVVVWFKAFSNETGDHVDERIYLDLDAYSGLQAYEYCNLHGLWQSPILGVVSPESWNLTLAGLASSDRDIVSHECDEAGELTVNLGQGRQIERLQLLESGDWDLGVRFPLGSWIGLGMNTEGMVDSDVAICSEAGGVVDCSEFSIPRRAAPVAGSENIVVVLESWSVDQEMGMAVSRFTQKSRALESPSLETRPDKVPVVYAFGSIADDGKLSYHQLDQRGYFSVKPLEQQIVDARLSVSLQDLDDRTVRSMHGALMIATYAVMVSTGAMIARYYRHTEWWLGTHRTMQLTATAVSFSNYALIALVFRGSKMGSVHSYTGQIFVAYTCAQSLMGSSIYYHSSTSNKILSHVHTSKVLNEEGKLLLREWALVHGSGNLFHALKVGMGDLNESMRKQVSAFLLEGVTALTISKLVSPAIFYTFMFQFPVMTLRRVHRFVGRAFSVSSYAQIISGAYTLNAGNTLNTLSHFIFFCVGILFLLLIYKELELQLGWPYSTEEKLLALINLWQRLCNRCKCRRRRRRNRTSVEKYDLNISTIETYARRNSLVSDSSTLVRPFVPNMLPNIQRTPSKTLAICSKKIALSELEDKIAQDLSKVPKLPKPNDRAKVRGSEKKSKVWSLNMITQEYE